MKNPFTQHPNSVAETYWQHFYRALKCSIMLLIASLACIAHAAFPFLFTTTSTAIFTKILVSIKNTKHASRSKKNALMEAAFNAKTNTHHDTRR